MKRNLLWLVDGVYRQDGSATVVATRSIIHRIIIEIERMKRMQTNTSYRCKLINFYSCSLGAKTVSGRPLLRLVSGSFATELLLQNVSGVGFRSSSASMHLASLALESLQLSQWSSCQNEIYCLRHILGMVMIDFQYYTVQVCMLKTRMDTDLIFAECSFCE